MHIHTYVYMHTDANKINRKLNGCGRGDLLMCWCPWAQASARSKWVRRDRCIRPSLWWWRIRMSNMIYSHVSHDSFICVIWLMWRAWRICPSPWLWRFHMCDMICSHVLHDSFTCVIWRMCVAFHTHSHVWDDLFMLSRVCVTWLIHMCHMTHSSAYTRTYTYIVEAAISAERVAEAAEMLATFIPSI